MQTLRRSWNAAMLIALVMFVITQPAVARGSQIKTAKPVYRSGEPIRIYYDSGYQPPPPQEEDDFPDFSEPPYTVTTSWDVRVCRSGTKLFRRLGKSEVAVGTSPGLPGDVYGNTKPRGWCTLHEKDGLAPGEYEVRLFEMRFALGAWPEDKPHPDPYTLLASHRFRVVEALTYKPPPALAVEAACFPRKPGPHVPVTLALRLQNHGDITAARVVVELEFLDPDRGTAPRDLEMRTSFCHALGAGRFRCELGDVEPDWTADLAFTATTPAGGMVLWRATLDSAGDLGGPADFGGILGERAPPAIVDVVVLADQKRVANTVPSYAYPTGRYKGVGTSRYLLVVGYNLPQRPGQDLELGSANPDVHHVFVAFPDTKNFAHKELFEEGWARFYELDDLSAAVERAAEDGYDGLLVRADLGKGVLPGRKTVRVKGAEGHWALEFGDISATIAFVREVKEEKKKEFDVLRNAYWPGRIHVAVVTSHELEIEEIPILLKAGELSAGLKQEIKLRARRAVKLGRRVYLSEPLDIHGRRSTPSRAGGVALPVDGRRPPMTLEARVDERFIHEKFRMPITPPIASVVLKAWPAGVRRSCLWYNALDRAARARDEEPNDWNTLSEQESKNVWNVIVFKWDILEQSVKFGQHAASILLRDTFVSVMERQVRKLEGVRSNRRQTLGLLQSMRPFAMDDSLPLNRMMVHDPKGRDIEYFYVIMNDVPFLAELHGQREEQIKAWQVRQTQAALDRLIKAAKEAIELALETEDDEVEDLILLTGFNFEPMARLLKAELVRREKRTLPDGSTRWAWVPDTVARRWVDQVAPLASAIREQQRLANADTDLCLAAVTLATLPFMLAENTGVALVCFAIDLLDLGVTTVQELSQYCASAAELDFALGASITIGVERHDQAVRDAKGWASTAFGIGGSAAGAFVGALEVVPKLTDLARIARGRIVAAATTTPTDVLKLEPVNLRDFVAFAVNARAKGVAHGVDSLTAVERRAIDVVEEVAASKHATAVFSEPDLPPSDLGDCFLPSSRIRFEVDVQSGAARVRLPSGKRVSTPRSSGGDPANGLVRRAPEGCVVEVLEKDGTSKRLLLGRWVGGGSFNEVFRHAEYPDEWVIRFPNYEKGSAPILLDEYGWEALENIQSPYFRLVEVKEVYEAAEGSGIGRVRVIEFIEENAGEMISRQGRMTSDQVLALDATLRDLNRRGLVWLDNHPGNFSFVPAAEGGGHLQVVIVDPGGIVRVRTPELAREIQRMVNGDFRTNYPNYPALENLPGAREGVRRAEVLERVSDELITPEGISIEGLFKPCLGERSGYLARIFDVDD